MRAPPVTDKEAAEKLAEQERKASADRWTIGLTGVLAFATLMQFAALLWQGRQLRRNVTVAENAANDARKAIAATQATATAAEQANRINQDALTATQRPWISVSIDAIEELTYNLSGATISLIFRLTNFGRTPAFYVGPHARAVLHQDGVDNVREQVKLVEEVRRTRPVHEFGLTIFPEKEMCIPINIMITKEQIDEVNPSAAPRKMLVPTIVGFVDYRSSFSAKPHETGFIYMLRIRQPESPGTPRPIFMDADTGYIPSENLVLQPSSLEPGGFFAT
jgi:hypothetical protein